MHSPVAAAPLRGHLRAGRVQPVVATLPAGARSLVVTVMRVHSGQIVRSGDVLAIVSGRPVIVVTSPFPFYRDLRIGDSGPDVRALQAVLQADGSSTAAPDGVFSTGTQDALGRYFAHRDVSPPQGSAEQVEARDRAAAAVADLLSTTPSAELSAARQALAQASRAAGPWLPMGELITIPSQTARVSAPVRRGAVVPDGEPLMQLSVGQSTVTARADALAVTDYRVGARVRILVAGAADGPVGTVSSIGPFIEGSGTASDFPGKDLTITFERALAAPNGTAVTVRPVGPSGRHQPAVPLVALREDSQGAYVLRKARDPASAGPQRVPVRVVGQADGYALVVSPGLRAGQLVQLGQ